ncbi:hypothetical protein IFM47457_08043 [Aspergillus lentulus]|nr:hypothetical protein IFM47457_08043 [Aspergillus lentulus]
MKEPKIVISLTANGPVAPPPAAGPVAGAQDDADVDADVAEEVGDGLKPSPDEIPTDPLHRFPFGQQAYSPVLSSIQYSPAGQLPEPSGQHV